MYMHQAFPALPYRKRRNAGRWTGNEARANQLSAAN